MHKKHIKIISLLNHVKANTKRFKQLIYDCNCSVMLSIFHKNIGTLI